VDNIYFIEYRYNQDFIIFLLALSYLLQICCCPQVILRECLWGEAGWWLCEGRAKKRGGSRDPTDRHPLWLIATAVPLI
jgi:hypothetical protein